MRKALVPGTYDPITNGHVDIIERSSHIFDRIVVGVAESPKKGGAGPLFTLEERVALVKESVAHLHNVEVIAFSSLLIDFAAQIGAQAIVKGLRVVTDFEFEFQQAALNYHLDPRMETLFIMSTPRNMYLSSSMIKEIATYKGSISDWVPPCVEKAVLARTGA